MAILQRVLLPVINAFVITCVLFYCMFLLIDMEQPSLREKAMVPKFDWVFVPQETKVNVVSPKPKPVEPTQIQPPVPEIELVTEYKVTEQFGDSAYKIPTGRKLVTPSDSQLTLIMGLQPSYPQRALQRGIEGYAVVGFSVNGAGRVFDPFVIESEPAGMFDKSALKAILGFKYKPHMVDGQPVSSDGQQYLFRYEMGQKPK